MTTDEFDFVCRLVRERSSIVLEAGKEYLVESRLAPIARQLQLGSVGELIGRLRSGSDNGLHIRVVEAMVTNETSFFRDIHPFEGLKGTVIPELMRARKSERQLNVWSAACSTGQEPYSFVIMLREHFPELSGWRVNVLATDLSTEVLGRAREGRYNQIEVNRGLPAPVLVRYFKQRGTQWELSEEIRRAVEFREMNLARLWPVLPKMDIIFLRNVMIYFDVETKKAILGRVARLLRPDSYLLLGSAETTLNLDLSFRRVENIKGGFYQLVG
ncbi:MAG: protein-glutamate O-methyltransferase CheR [Planctomycetia bacterium]|nr:protein-glutamate O-methyltransferase CheR [Planctomycetia bacterium]